MPDWKPATVSWATTSAPTNTPASKNESGNYGYDNLAKGVVFTGCLHDVLAYEFSSNVSFEKTIEAFDFEYIL